ITFRWEEALSLEGNSAPFLQSAHARACSILAKADDHGPADFRLLVHPQEQMLIRWIAKFPSTVREAADGRRVHAVAGYAADFASSSTCSTGTAPCSPRSRRASGGRVLGSSMRPASSFGTHWMVSGLPLPRRCEIPRESQRERESN